MAPRMYDDLAPFYDNGVRDRFSELIAARLERALRAEGAPPPSNLLDLGCGTGRVSLGLARAGYAITGLDSSERMLDIARRRAEQAGVRLDLRVGDLRTFTFDERFDGAYAAGDVLNHLLEERDLQDAIAGAAEVLLPGSPLLFDVNTLAMYRSTLWNVQDSTVETEQFTMTTHARFDPRSGIGRVDTIVIERTMLSERERRGTVRQRWWSEDDLRRVLGGSGFEVVSVAPFHPLEMPSELPELVGTKAFYTCRRR
jgi:SAM-dependent methyltransferase